MTAQAECVRQLRVHNKAVRASVSELRDQAMALLLASRCQLDQPTPPVPTRLPREWPPAA